MSIIPSLRGECKAAKEGKLQKHFLSVVFLRVSLFSFALLTITAVTADRTCNDNSSNDGSCNERVVLQILQSIFNKLLIQPHLYHVVLQIISNI